MTSREKGFLLLASNLGDPDRRCLTVPQLRTLAFRARSLVKPAENRQMTVEDLCALGYCQEEARRIITLLGQEALLQAYLEQANRFDCSVITRASEDYPVLLRQRLGLDSPGCLWVKGDLSILTRPGVALVGSRDLRPENCDFAREVGRQAAQQGLALVSGNARGADREGQAACLKSGGQVISFVADELWRHPLQRNVLYVSEEGFDLPFSSQRALSRNHCIHAVGLVTFVAQVTDHKGGTWAGTFQNLSHGWSPVVCFRDGSAGALALEQMGAYLVDKENLTDFGSLPRSMSFFDPV